MSPTQPSVANERKNVRKKNATPTSDAVPITVRVQTTAGTPPSIPPGTLNPASAISPAQPRRHPRLRVFGKSLLFLSIVLIVAGAAFTYEITFSQDGFFKNSNNPFSQVKNLLMPSGDKQLQGEDQDRVNILLIGYGGPGHEGSYLADTIILASIKPSTKQVSMLSLPRDFFVPIPGNSWRKINNALALGRSDKDKEGGEKLLVQTVENVTGLEIPYYVQIDFTGFTKAIDTLGGIDVNVVCGFADYQYPTLDYGYQTIAFKQGPAHLNGELALKYARSRHGITTTKGCDPEGTDFARSRRQQQILSAAKEKALSIGTLLRPDKILGTLQNLGTHAGTNLQLWEFARLVDLTKDIGDGNITNITLDETNLLYSTYTEDGAYVLRPKAGLDNFSGVRALAANVFAADPIEGAPTITLINGGAKSTAFTQTAQILKTQGLTATTATMPDLIGYEKTVIYDQTNGQKPQHLQPLKQALSANIATVLPADLIGTTKNGTPVPKYPTDFVIVVGSK